MFSRISILVPNAAYLRYVVTLAAMVENSGSPCLFDRLLSLVQLKYFNAAARGPQKLFTFLHGLVSPLAKFAQKQTALHESHVKDAVLVSAGGRSHTWYSHRKRVS
jgi:hypothetical protein